MDAANLDFRVLAPIGFVSIGALAVLMLEVLLAGPRAAAGPKAVGVPERRESRRTAAALALVASLALACAIYTALAMFADGTQAFFNPARPMLELDGFTSLVIAIVGLGALISVVLSITYLRALHIDHGEYYALLLLATAGMFLMVSAVDLMAVFLGLELMSVPIYALAGFDRRKLRSNEAGLKYFLIGAFASAILLYGMALLYGATGQSDFAGIRAAFDYASPLALAGLALVIVGFSFKVSVVPFHLWTPDVYEGAPTSVTAFMSVTVKAAGVAILLRFLSLALPGVDERLDLLFAVLAALSMVVGNAMALIQTSLKRMLAYSSVAHVGYILVAFVAGSEQAYSAVLFYLFVYVFMNLGAFAVIVALARGGQECERIDDFAGLASSRPGLAALMTLFMLALAGIPGTAGFIAKFYVFAAAVNADLLPLVILGVLTSVMSVFYYLQVPVAMYMREAREEEQADASSSEWLVLVACALLVLYLGFFPDRGPFEDAAEYLNAPPPVVATLPR